MSNLLNDRERCIAHMRAWLVDHNPRLVDAALDEHTDLVASGALDSLALVEFMLFIEEQSGQRVLGENFDPDDVRCLSRIYARYYAGSQAAARAA